MHSRKKKKLFEVGSKIFTDGLKLQRCQFSVFSRNSGPQDTEKNISNTCK